MEKVKTNTAKLFTDSFADHGIRTNGQTGQKKTTCPRCSHTRKKSDEPCLSFSTDKGEWKCHHCEWCGALRMVDPDTGELIREGFEHAPDPIPPPTTDEMIAAAKAYVLAGFAICPVEAGTKKPRGVNWGKRPLTPRTIETHFKKYPDDGIGAIHSKSHTFTLDIDAPALAKKALAAVGLDLDKLTAQGKQCIGGHGKSKAWFQLPQGESLNLLQLKISGNGSGKITVFELRCSDGTKQVQDVLPPSVHPDTKEPYRWADGKQPGVLELPILPAELLDLHKNWPEKEKAMKDALLGEPVSLPDKKSKSKGGRFALCMDWMTDSGRAARLRMNDFRLCSETLGDDGEWRLLADADELEIYAASHSDGTNFGFDMIKRAVALAAARQKVNPLQDYLNALQWDGTARLETMFSDYFGAERTEHVENVGRRWLISAVARALRPGCKMDTCIVLEGWQGQMKSEAMKRLAGGSAYFSDTLPSLKHPGSAKDAAQQAGGKWIIECAEMGAFKGVPAEVVKAFISSAVDTYRPPHGRYQIDRDRPSVIVVTTNEHKWSDDVTGNRRFWPVACGEIDLEAITRDRDQLLAEAVHRLNAKEQWWFTAEEEKTAQAEQRERVRIDPWTDRVLALVYAWKLPFVHESDIARILDRRVGGLEIAEDRLTKAHSGRVRDILTHAGFTEGRARIKREGRMTSDQIRGLWPPESGWPPEHIKHLAENHEGGTDEK